MPAFLYITSANASADMNKARALRLAAKRYAQPLDRQHGLEAYLFQIQLSRPVDESDVADLFQKIGMTCLPKSAKNKSLTEYRSYYFELRDTKRLDRGKHDLFTL
jgi:hypothetical protein